MFVDALLLLSRQEHKALSTDRGLWNNKQKPCGSFSPTRRRFGRPRARVLGEGKGKVKEVVKALEEKGVKANRAVRAAPLAAVQQHFVAAHFLGGVETALVLVDCASASAWYATVNPPRNPSRCPWM